MMEVFQFDRHDWISLKCTVTLNDGKFSGSEETFIEIKQQDTINDEDKTIWL